jgi:P4 family phage/plasmid primase-like protien
VQSVTRSTLPPHRESLRVLVISYVANVRASALITTADSYETFAKLVGIFCDPDEFLPAESKDELPLFIAAEFGGQRRIASNVLRLHALVLDFDHGSNADLEQAQHRLRQYGCIVYSSFSHSAEQHKFRAIVKLSRPVEGPEWLKFWPRAVHELRVSQLVDSKCADAPHMYFVPGGDRTKYVVFGSDGPGLDVDAILAAPLPPGAVEAYDAGLCEQIPEEQRGAITQSLRDHWDANLQNLCEELRKRPYPGTIYDLCNGKVFGVARGVPHIVGESRVRNMVRHALNNRYNKHLELPSVEADRARAFERVDKAIEDGKRQCWWPSRSDDKTSRPLTDIGLAERLVDQHHEDLAYEPGMEQWFEWNEKFWDGSSGTGPVQERMIKTIRSVLDETDALAADLIATKDAFEQAQNDPSVLATTRVTLGMNLDMLVKRAEEIAKFAVKSETLSKVKSGIELASSSPLIVRARRSFDKNPYLLNFENGTLDLRTGVLHQHRRADYNTRIVPHLFDPRAECPVTLDALRAMMLGRERLVQYFLKLLAYTAIGVRTEQLFVICIGGGANGKSTIMNLMLEAFGKEANGYGFAGNGEYLLTTRGGTQHPTWRMSFAGKRLVGIQEVDEGRNLNESLLKELTGGDPITGRKLYQNEWTYDPELCLWLCTNHLPHVRGVDEGIWRRPRLIPFEADFRANPDRLLPQKLRREIPGLWALIAREEQKLILEPESLQEPREVVAATLQYRRDEDPLQGFLEAFFEMRDTNAFTPRKVVWGAYLEHNQTLATKPTFHSEKFFYAALEKRFKIIAVRGQRGFKGLRLLVPKERHDRSPKGQFQAAQSEATKKTSKPN